MVKRQTSDSEKEKEQETKKKTATKTTKEKSPKKSSSTKKNTKTLEQQEDKSKETKASAKKATAKASAKKATAKASTKKATAKASAKKKTTKASTKKTNKQEEAISDSKIANKQEEAISDSEIANKPKQEIVDVDEVSVEEKGNASIKKDPSYALIKRPSTIDSEKSGDKKNLSFITLFFVLIGIVIITTIPVFLSLEKDLHLPIDISSKIQQILAIFPVLLVTILCLIVAKFVYQKSVSFSLGDELTEKDNPAVGLGLMGYLMGIGLSLIGTISYINQNGDLTNNLESIIENLIPCFLLSLVLMFISQWILDKLILYKFSVDKEIAVDRNLGTGAIVCGAFIATGLILMKSFNSTIDKGFVDYFFSVTASFFVGQLVFVIGGWLFTKLSNFPFHEEVEYNDNASAGILFGGLLVGLGLVISAAITHVKWENPLLFTASIDLVENFHQEKVDEAILQKFQENKSPLSVDAKIISQEPNVWLIKNPNHIIQYKVKKVATEMEIYSNNLLLITSKKSTIAFSAGILGTLLLLIMGMWASKLLFFRISIAKEIQQKNVAVTLIITCVYIITGLVIQTLLNI